MMIELPRRIDRYRVEAILGTGGFATVYRARDERLDATVAVKVLAENHCHDADVRERFLKEGRVLRRIGSPHVVAVHDLGETERGQPYLVLEHADRGDLASRARTRRSAGWRPSAADMMLVAGALSDALAAVHASHLVHRDVAPRNLLLRSTRTPGSVAERGLVDPDERILLADLGLSKDLAAASGLTIGGGTAGFTPPEQRTGASWVDAAADIWAASAVVVWLLLGRPPDDSGRWRRDLVAVWSDHLVAALTRGLDPVPARRYGGITDWLAALGEAVSQTTATNPRTALLMPADTQPVPPAAAEPATVPKQRRRLVAVALLLAIALGAGGALTMERRLDPDPRQTVEVLQNGQVRVLASGDGHAVAIIGPTEVPVGQTTTFEAGKSPGVVHWTWIAPDGEGHADVGRLQVNATSEGRATVTLIGTDGQGGRVEAAHTFRVVGG